MRPFVILGKGRVSLSIGWFKGMEWALLKCNVLYQDTPVFHILEFQFLKFVIEFAICEET